MIFNIFIGIVSCGNNYPNKPISATKVVNLELIDTVSNDTAIVRNIISEEDSMQVEKVDKKLRQTKWYKEVLRTSQKVSVMILPPDETDTLHYWFKVGDNRPDRFVTFRQYATKKGEWKLLFYDTVEGRLIPVRE